MDTKALIEKYGIRANKNFGQNFLHRQDIIEKIADAASGTPLCLEVGAGLGVLSRELCRRFEKVTTVEIDKSLSDVTEYTLADADNHTLIYANFLKTDISKIKTDMGGMALTVAGNLPYNITGEIITKLLKSCDHIEKAVVMVQREAAEKLAASPEDEGYRAISVLTQYYCDIETLCDVAPDCFIPAPHVTSRVVILRFKKERALEREREAEFYAFVHNVFSKRRKLLTAIMKTPEEKKRAQETLISLGFSEKTRGEQMTPSELSEFFKAFYK